MQAEQLKAVALRVCDKFYTQPLARLQGKAEMDSPASPSTASDLQHMPATLPCLDFRLVWRPPAEEQDAIVTIWRPVAPPGFAPLGDVCSMGTDKPVEPAMVCALAGLPELVHASSACFTGAPTRQQPPPSHLLVCMHVQPRPHMHAPLLC